MEFQKVGNFSKSDRKGRLCSMQSVIKGTRLPGLSSSHVASRITLNISVQLTYQENRMRVVRGSFYTRPGSGVRHFSIHISLAGTRSPGHTKLQGRL